MEEKNNSRDSLGYLGPSFQLKVLWQILTDIEFGNEIVPNLQSHYFDVAIQKKLLSLIKKYQTANGKIPQLSNRSMAECISGSNFPDTEKEELHGTVKRIVAWEKLAHTGEQDNDGKIVQRNVWLFVKQQEYKKFADKIYEKIKTGSLEENVYEFEDTIKKIQHLGVEDDNGSEVFDDIDSALEDDFRNPIPTGISAVDNAMDGGLGTEEMGLILAALGVGKTTILTKIANTAFDVGKNVLHIIFEDKVDAIKRKHYAIWSKVPLGEFKPRKEEVREKVRLYKEGKINKLILKKMDQDGVTIPLIKNWILNYQKNTSIKFDIVVLDYIDCVESHKPTGGDDLKGELIVIKAFEAMAAELKIPCWSACQGNRSAISSEYVGTDQMGGSIKKAQKTHFLMSVAKSPEQRQNDTANMEILKARFAKDGLKFENAIFNNNTLEIRCIEYFKAKPIPFKPNGNLESDLDNKMREEFNNSINPLDLAVEDYEKRISNDIPVITNDLTDQPKEEKKPEDDITGKLPDNDDLGYQKPLDGDLETPEI